MSYAEKRGLLSGVKNIEVPRSPLKEDVSLDKYFKSVEDCFAPVEMEAVRRFLETIIHTPTGKLRSYDKITQKVFFLRQDPKMALLGYRQPSLCITRR
jgi:hypothetical protein